VSARRDIGPQRRAVTASSEVAPTSALSRPTTDSSRATTDLSRPTTDSSRPTSALIYAEPKIDTHCHVLDPVRFPYGEHSVYRPSGQEIGTAEQLMDMFAAYGVARALLVGPNSGYEEDNRCMLDAIARGEGRLKGIAVVPRDSPMHELERLKARGIVGVAFNATFHGVEYYRDCADLLATLERLGMCVSLQVQGDQLLALAPLVERSGVRLLIDHCGRPATEAGVDQPGFRKLLSLATTKRVCVKLSGYVKFARAGSLYDDVRPYVDALLDAFTPDACTWASDWPFLRAVQRVDVGPLLKLFERLVPAADDRRRIFWETPCRVLDFPD
jgi:predicted TIM-barrel fold metal-dependent hydrolase